MNHFEPFAPTFRIYVEDDTGPASSAEPGFIERCGGGLYSVWVLIEESGTYICSMTPSSEIHFLGGGGKGMVDDATYEEIMDAYRETPEVDYRDYRSAVRNSFPLHEMWGREPNAQIASDKEELEEQLEGVLESLRCNGGVENAIDFYLKRRDRGVAEDIFKAVLAAMQGAEEIQGPGVAEYVALMRRIAATATERANTAEANGR